MNESTVPAAAGIAAPSAGDVRRAIDPERASFVGDTRTSAIVAGVLLGVAMVAGEQVAERVDTIVFAGIFPIFGIIVHLIFNLTAVFTYGLAAALIVANINPIVSVATATGPLSPLWFFTNTATSIGARVVQYYMIRKGPREMTYRDALAAAFGGMIPNSAIMFPVQLLYFQLPFISILAFKVAELVTGTFIPAGVALKASQALRRSTVRA